jgi:hypothetical protein
MMKRLMMVASVLAMVGCSGSVSGTVGGVSLSVSDAIFAVLKDDSGKSTGLFVVMADKPKLCDSLKANREPKSATSLIFSLSRITDTDYLAPDVGEYTVIDENPRNAGNFGFASFSRTDANCTNTLSASASTARSGLVKVTNLKGEVNGNASATFDVTFGGGDKITGNFNATYCDVSKLQLNPNCE